MVAVLQDGIVKTRKPHKCHGCCETIPAGTHVYHQKCTDEGIYEIYMCDACREWCRNMENKDICFGNITKGCRDCIDAEQAFEGYVKECRNDRSRR